MANPIPQELVELQRLTGPHDDGARVSDVHWLLARFARQAEAMAGLGTVAWERYLANARAGVAAQWAALRARARRMPRRGGR